MNQKSREMDMKIKGALTTFTNILDYVVNRNEVLALLISKLRYGGRISFTGVDLDSISLSLVARKITATQAANALYSGRLAVTTLEEMSKKLMENGLEVITHRLQEPQYFITARRHANTNVV